MTIEIYYHVNGEYTIIDGPATLGHAETYHEAAEIEASYLEAKHSATMGGALNHIDDDEYSTSRRCPTCGDEGDCPDCGIYTDNRPLLAQCAAFIRAVGENRPLKGMLAERARLIAALAEAGW